MSATLVWFSGAETGSLKEFPGSPGGGASIVASPVRTGSYSLLTPIQSGVPAAKVRIAGLSATTYLRAYFWTSSNVAAKQAILGIGTNGSQSRMQVWLNTDGTVGQSRGVFPSTPDLSGSDAINLSAWNLLEVKFVRSASVGGLEVYLNGVLQTSDFTGNTTVGTSDTVTTLQLGDVDGSDSGSGQNLYWDDLAFGTGAYIGAGQSIATQGTAGSPTYDAWTKVGDTTAALCWSETPFSTGKNCTSIVLADQQTMLAATLGSITASATINGAFICAVAKSAASSSIKLLRRVAGADTVSASRVTTTTDRFIPDGLNTETMDVFVDTLTNLNSMEIGAQANDAVNLATVEDMWLLVDYTPGPPVTLTTTLPVALESIGTLQADLPIPFESFGETLLKLEIPLALESKGTLEFALPMPFESVVQFKGIVLALPFESDGKDAAAFDIIFDILTAIQSPLLITFSVVPIPDLYTPNPLLVTFSILEQNPDGLTITFSVLDETLIRMRTVEDIQAPVAQVTFS